MENAEITAPDSSVSSQEQLLREVFANLRVDGSLYFDSCLHGEWGMTVGASAHVQFHCVASGTCWLATASEQVLLSSGDIALCMRGQSHTLSSQPGLVLATDQEYLHSLKNGVPLFRDGRMNHRLLCGHFALADRDAIPFLLALPDLVVVHQQNESLQWATVLRTLLERPGLAKHSDPVSNRLAEALMIRFLWGYFQQQSQESGNFSAMRDRRVARALMIFHRYCHKPLTVEQVAEAVGMSRSAFSVLFKRLLKLGPMEYLNSWRLYRARQMLKKADSTLMQISLAVGYSSEAALSRAFKRHYNLTPSEYRRSVLIQN